MKQKKDPTWIVLIKSNSNNKKIPEEQQELKLTENCGVNSWPSVFVTQKCFNLKLIEESKEKRNTFEQHSLYPNIVFKTI